MRPGGYRRAVVVVIGAALVAGGCTPRPPSPTTSPAPNPAFAWSRARVELPAEVTEVAPGSTAGMPCSPCHASQASLFVGVTPLADGALAVGVQQPPSTAIAYRSLDGRRWSPLPGFGPGEDTVALAAAQAGDRIVIVGRAAGRAAAWASDDGASWTAAPDDPALRGPLSAEMDAVIAWRGGFVAAGVAVGGTSARTAVVWISPDGLRWRRVSSGAGFEGARASGIAAGGGTLVVVGARGAEGDDRAIAWRSSDGERWASVTSDSFAAGPMRAVCGGPAGFVAVGSGVGDDRAATWTSPDGAAWTAGPTGPDLANGGRPIRMLAVASVGSGFVAAGWKSDAGNGSGVVWRSTDGRTWRRVPDQVSMSGASLAGVVVVGGAPVVVGTSGYPDNDQAAAWLEGPDALDAP